MILQTYESFTYNEGLKLSKEQIEKGLDIVKSKMPLNKFIKYIKKHRKHAEYLIKKFTNGKDKIYANKLLVKNEGFKDSFIYALFIEPFYDGDWMGKVMGGFMWIVAIFLGFMIYLLGVMFYLNFIYTPMDRGVIQDKEFVKAHTVVVTTYVMVGKVMTPITNVVHVPDTYNFEIKEIDGDGVEGWCTTDMHAGDRIARGDTISWDDAIFDVTSDKD